MKIELLSTMPMTAPRDDEKMLVLGVPVSITNFERTVQKLNDWAKLAKLKTIFVREVSSLMLATENAYLLNLHHQASMVLPDGMPLVWIGKRRGFGERIGRTCGPDVLNAICAETCTTELKHFFYGGKPGVAETMALKLAAKHQGLKVAGTFSPPMRDIDHNFKLTAESLNEIEMIKKSDPDFIWIGISSPKQEYWMMQASPHFSKGIFVGVGAAFDFHAGTVNRAPLWMQKNGLEWVYRLWSEPMRLWKRYLILVPKFVFRLVFERIHHEQ
jgi:N-acetylglucosaminyldiphosphoundecaprenol N-acetyl-beta-D-mannosaminyltransferase